MAIQPIPGFTQATPVSTVNQTPLVNERSIVGLPNDMLPQRQIEPSPAADNELASPSPLAKQPSREQIDQAMKEVKQALPFQARDLQFSIDDDTGRTVIKIVDPATKEVIRQMPSEELLAITKALDKFTGLLAKQKV